MRKNCFLLILFAMLCNFNCMLYGSLNFANRSSSLVLGDVNSKIRINGTENIYGWAEHSLIKNSPRNSSWLTPQTTYGYSAGQTAPNNYMVYNNSNAIVKLAEGGGGGGSGGTVYETMQTYTGDAGVNGFTWYKAGFDIYPGYTLSLATPAPISGDILIGGALSLGSDLFLDSMAQLVIPYRNKSDKSKLERGGYYNTLLGNGRALHLNGNLTVPSGFTLNIVGNTLIEGNGNTLTFEDDAELFVDSSSDLKLRNLNVKTGTNSSGGSPIILNNTDSRLTLDNVQLSLAEDFIFNQGQLSVCNNVEVLGQSAFVYKSPCESHITSGGTFKFNPGSTFYFKPDLLYTPPAINPNSETGGIKDVFEGSQAWDSSSVSNAWNPDGNYLVVCHQETGSVKTYMLGGTDTGGFVETTGGAQYFGYAYSVAWSPDGNYVAVVGQLNGEGDYRGKITIYHFDLTQSGGLEEYYTQYFNEGVSSLLGSVSWNPSGNHIVVGGEFYNGISNIGIIKTYSFYPGSGISEVGSGYQTFENVLSIKKALWSPDGSYIVAAGHNYPEGEVGIIKTYVFTNSGTTGGLDEACTGYQSFGTWIVGCAWSPNSQYVAIGTTDGYLKAYAVDTEYSGGLREVGIDYMSPGDSVESIVWTLDGNYVIASYGNYLLAYKFINGGDAGGFEQVGYDSQYFGDTDSIVCLSLRSDGNYVCASGENGPFKLFEIDWLTLPKDLLMMDDSTSRLWLNGCTLKASTTGLRLTKGQVLLENRVSFENNLTPEINSANEYGGIVDWYSDYQSLNSMASASWSPDGRYLVVGSNDDGGIAKTYTVGDGPGGLIEIGSGSQSLGNSIDCLAWNSTSNYIAASGTNYENGGIVKIYYFNAAATESGGLEEVDSSTEYFGSEIYSVAWDPTGNYLVVGGTYGEGEGFVKTYSFNPTDGLQEVGSYVQTFGNEACAVSWGSVGNYIVASGDSGGEGIIKTYVFDQSEGSESGGLIEAGTNYQYFDEEVYCCTFSPNGQYVAVGSDYGNLKSYQVTGVGENGGLEEVGSDDMSGMEFINSIAWTLDGQYVITVDDNYDIIVHKFIAYGDQGGFEPAASGEMYFSEDWLSCVVINPNGTDIAVTSSDGPFKLFKLDWIGGGVPAISNAIMFGNSASGSDYDANVRLLSGANVQINGVVNFDNTESFTLFDNDNARFVLQNSDSKIRLNPTTVLGWQDSSIINNVANAGLGDYNLNADVADLSKLLYYSGMPNTLVGSNWNILADNVITVSNNTVLNGNGNTINLGANSQLFVNDNVTLTLKNVVLKSSRNGTDNPQIKLATDSSKLVLDNVKVDFADAFNFNRGQLFVRNDVNFTGTNAFVYRSAMPSHITSGATLKFNPGTTFHFKPNAGNATDSIRNVFDGYQNLNDDHTSSTAWSPDGNYLTVCYWGSGIVKVYSVGDGPGGLVEATDGIQLFDGQAYGVAWSPDGQYVVVCGENDDNKAKIIVYRLNLSQPGGLEGVSEQFIESESLAFMLSVSWNPSGNYIVVGGGFYSDPPDYSYIGGIIKTYSFNIESGLVEVGSGYQNFGDADIITSAQWSPDGNYIVASGYDSNEGTQGLIKTYVFAGADSPGGLDDACSGYQELGTWVFCCKWSPNSQNIAVGTFDFGSPENNFLKSYTLDLSSDGGLREVGSNATLLNVPIISLAWTTNGEYVITGDFSSALTAHKFINGGDQGGFEPVSSSPQYFVEAGPLYNVTMRPDGNYISASGITGAFKLFELDFGTSGKDLLVMDDVTSKLWLDGCTLKATTTGIRLTKGQLLLEDKVSFINMRVINPATITGGINDVFDGTQNQNSVSSVAWSPDGNYVVVGDWDLGTVKTYIVGAGPGGLVEVGSGYQYFGTEVHSVAWDPTGNYVVANGHISDEGDKTGKIKVYRFNPVESTSGGLEEVANSEQYIGEDIYSVAWNPTGNYLVAAGYLIGEGYNGLVKTYAFNSESGLQEVGYGYQYFGAAAYAVSWSHDGNYIVSSGYDYGEGNVGIIKTYVFVSGESSTGGLNEAGSGYMYFDVELWCCTISPDSQYVAVGSENGNLKSFRIIGIGENGGLEEVGSGYTSGMNYLDAVVWTLDGQYVITADDNNALIAHKFIGGGELGGFEPVGSGAQYFGEDYLTSVAVRPDGNYIVASNNEGAFKLYQIDWVGNDMQDPGTPALSNSIVFGDSSVGSSSDLKVRLLSGANVEVNGIVNFDNTQSCSMFDNDNARFILDNADCKIRLNPEIVYGWQDRSIIKKTVNQGVGDYNLRDYADHHYDYDRGNKLATRFPPLDDIITYQDAPGELVLDNSNAIVSLDRRVTGHDGDISSINSSISSINSSISTLDSDVDALDQRVTNNSNAIVFLSRGNGQLPINNSNAIVKLAHDLKTNSNALIYGITNNSNTLLALARYNSNALRYGIRNNSNTLLALARYNSNALRYGIRNNSNTLLALARYNSNALNYGIRNNSNVIVKLTAQMETIDHGPENIIIENTSTYTMAHDIYLSKDHTLEILNSCEINGNGHTIHFPDKALFPIEIGHLVNVAQDSEVMFKNVTLQYFDDSAITLTYNSSVVFGEQVTIELNRIQPLSMPWIFRGTGEGDTFDRISTIRGGSIVMGDYGIHATDDILLCFGSTTINDLSDSYRKGYDYNDQNLTVDENSALAFYNASLYMASDYTFSNGMMFILGDTKIHGPYTFNYQSNLPMIMLPFITPTANLCLTDNITFNYAPESDNRDLIQMYGNNTGLHLQGCTLASTTTGMRLHQGSLVIEGKNFISNNAASLSEATCFDDNLNVTILPGATLDIVDGIVDFQNQQV